VTFLESAPFTKRRINLPYPFYAFQAKYSKDLARKNEVKS